LLCETLPTPKEFKDAIESLSPEQQRFAKAYRAMQLASTLFGVVVLQVKPQLEKVLKLPADSLTKEIRLTQDLLELFMKYQISSDLISFEGDVNLTKGEKVAQVKRHVKAMQDMIAESRQKDLEEQQQVQLMRQAESRTHSYESAPLSRAYSATTTTTSSLSAATSYTSALPTGSRQAQPQASTPAKGEPKQPEQSSAGGTVTITVPVEHEDYTKLPGELDNKFERLDEDSALRSTIIKPTSTWTKSYQKALLAAPEKTTLYVNNLEEEKKKTYDLLDCLSRSGCLCFDHASLHLVLAATHCFDKTITETAIQDNVNPIEKRERSMLIIGSTVHQKPAEDLVKPELLQRVSTFNPILFGDSPALLERKAEVKSFLVTGDKGKEKEKVK